MSDTAGGPERLQIEGLTVQRGGRAVVREVDLEIPAGEVTALLGPNGAGKSSLVLAVGGVLRPQRGSVRIGDRDYASRRPERIRRAGVAIVPEGRRLLPELTVEENIRVATYSLSRSEAQSGRARALELFPELQKRLDRPGPGAVGRRAADGGARPGAGLPAALRPDRRALARACAGGRQPPDPHDPRSRRVGDRRAADRAVRDGRARPRQPRLHHGGRQDPVLGRRQGAAREPGAAAHRLPAARQQRRRTARRRSPAASHTG